MKGRFAEQLRSSSTRLALFYGALFAVGIFLMLLLVYREATAFIDHRVDRIVGLYAARMRPLTGDALARAIDEAVRNDPRRINYYGLFDDGGRRLAGNVVELPRGLVADGEIREWPLGVAPDRAAASAGEAADPAEPAAPSAPQEASPGSPATVRVRALALRVAGDRVLFVGRDFSELSAIRRILLGNLTLGGTAILVLGIGCGILFSVRTLRRIHAMRESTARFTRGELGVRIPVQRSNDDLDMLAIAVNQMLDEIERLINEVKSVTDAVAHDLRTPLTRLRISLARAQQRFVDDPGESEFFERALAETDALLSRFHALLRISEIETGLRKAGFQAVDLNPLLTDLVELFEPVAEERQITLQLDLPEPARIVRVFADDQLLLEGLSNLLDNALKFTPPGGRVQVSLRIDAGHASIEVRDSGPGIPAPARGLVFERFYRVHPETAASGHGLGLSIVAAIARLHGFTLSMPETANGTVVRIDAGPAAG